MKTIEVKIDEAELAKIIETDNEILRLRQCVADWEARQDDKSVRAVERVSTKKRQISELRMQRASLTKRIKKLEGEINKIKYFGKYHGGPARRARVKLRARERWLRAVFIARKQREFRLSAEKTISRQPHVGPAPSPEPIFVGPVPPPGAPSPGVAS